jgi:hypothetical protein
MGCTCNKELPSARTMATNAIATAGRVMVAAFTGKKILVSPEVKAARMKICKDCEFVIQHPKYPERYRCSKCGCHMNQSWLSAPGFSKAELATESCPLDPPKWEAIK